MKDCTFVPMQLFFASNIKPGPFELPADEARHAVHVLRKKVGDILHFVDGKGGWFEGEIIDTGKRSCSVIAKQTKQEERRASSRLIMAVSPTKSNDRFEWFLEKATEIGVDKIIPLQCKRTERPRIRIDRYEKVLVSAMKQSLQAWLPELTEFTKINDFVKDLDASQQCFVAWCEEDEEILLVNNYQKGEDVCIMIGPEGDFTAAEIQMIKDKGGKAVSLGKNRLRTETAAIYATQTVALKNNLE